MKSRILNFGFPATHESITTIGTLNEALSISDFDSFVFDPNKILGGLLGLEAYPRRQKEIADLVAMKGGVVVCVLRPVQTLGFAHPVRNADTYGILEQSAPTQISLIRAVLRSGFGSQVRMISNAKGASAGYFRVLQGTLRFAAYLERDSDSFANMGGTVFAVDSVGYPIGVELAIGPGRICFVPVPDGATGDRVGSAVVRVVEAHYGGPSEIEVPSWLVEVEVPGATRHDAAISVLEEKQGQIEAEVEQLRQTKSNLLNYRVLLYGYGKSVLEPAVRSAFRLLQFEVPEPDKYMGEWDVELHVPMSQLTAVGEVEGSEGVVDVDKYRQLLDYVQAEFLDGRDHKGILIGNGYRLTSPDAPERQEQFSAHALRGAQKNGFCLLPTTELFKAVCSVLEDETDQGRKMRIRDSILSTVGVWRFAREAATSPDLSGKSADQTS